MINGKTNDINNYINGCSHVYIFHFISCNFLSLLILALPSFCTKFCFCLFVLRAGTKGGFIFKDSVLTGFSWRDLRTVRSQNVPVNYKPTDIYFPLSLGHREHPLLLLRLREEWERSRKYQEIWPGVETLCLQEKINTHQGLCVCFYICYFHTVLAQLYVLWMDTLWFLLFLITDSW